MPLTRPRIATPATSSGVAVVGVGGWARAASAVARRPAPAATSRLGGRAPNRPARTVIGNRYRRAWSVTAHPFRGAGRSLLYRGADRGRRLRRDDHPDPGGT